MLVWFKRRLFWRICRLRHHVECSHARHRANGCDCGHGITCECALARGPFADYSAP